VSFLISARGMVQHEAASMRVRWVAQRCMSRGQGLSKTLHAGTRWTGGLGNDNSWSAVGQQPIHHWRNGGGFLRWCGDERR